MLRSLTLAGPMLFCLVTHASAQHNTVPEILIPQNELGARISEAEKSVAALVNKWDASTKRDAQETIARVRKAFDAMKDATNKKVDLIANTCRK